MSLLPHILGLVDDFSSNQRNNYSIYDPCFGLQIHPGQLRRLIGPSSTTQRFPSGYRRNWEVSPADSSNLIATTEKDEFQVSMDVQQFKPEEITVKIVDDCIVVEGKHEDRQDDHGFISRQFVRKYSLPTGYNTKDVISTLSSDGVLTLKANLPKAENTERVIEIQQTGPTKI